MAAFISPFLRYIVVLVDVVLCTSKQCYFTKRNGNDDVLTKVPEGKFTVKYVDIFGCADECLSSTGCNAFWYNRRDRSCSVVTGDMYSVKQRAKSEWVLWTRKHEPNESPTLSPSPSPSPSPTVSHLLVFDSFTSTRILNLDTGGWFGVKTCDYRCQYVGSAVFDSQTQTLFWAFFAPNTLFSAPVRNIQDLRPPRVSRFTKNNVQGVSLDVGRRLLFYLRNKELLSMDLRDKKETEIVSVEGKVEFGYCRTVVEESKQLVYFHTRHRKYIYKAGYKGGYECYPTATQVVNLHIDETGGRLLWTDNKNEFVWTMGLADMKMGKLMLNLRPYYVFPLEEELFIWEQNRYKYMTMKYDLSLWTDLMGIVICGSPRSFNNCRRKDDGGQLNKTMSFY